jgi:hypothetical protein
MNDDTPIGMYGESNTKRGMIGRPFRGLNLSKVKLDNREKQIAANLM